MCVLSCAADGKSTIVCSEDFIVFEDGVNVTDALVVDGEILCNYTYALTGGDVSNLETAAVVNVTAKDEHDYRVGASATETVPLSQVTSEKRSHLGLDAQHGSGPQRALNHSSFKCHPPRFWHKGNRLTLPLCS